MKRSFCFSLTHFSKGSKKYFKTQPPIPLLLQREGGEGDEFKFNNLVKSLIFLLLFTSCLTAQNYQTEKYILIIKENIYNDYKGMFR